MWPCSPGPDLSRYFQAACLMELCAPSSCCRAFWGKAHLSHKALNAQVCAVVCLAFSPLCIGGFFLLVSGGKQGPCQLSCPSTSPLREEFKKEWMGGWMKDGWVGGWIDGWRGKGG